MKVVKRVSNWRYWPLLIVAVLQLWTLVLILYRIRNIDEPREVHVMLPQIHSSATEISCDRN